MSYTKLPSLSFALTPWFLKWFKASRLTPPLWRDLVKLLTRKLYFSLEQTDFKNVIFEKIPWAPLEDAEVAKVK